MKVLFIAHSGKLEGAGYALLNILSSIRNYAVEPILIIPQKDSLYELVKKYNIKTYIVDTICYETLPAVYGWKSFVAFPVRYICRVICIFRTYRAIKKIAIDERVNIIHSNSGVISVGFKVAEELYIPHVWHIREYGDIDFNLKPLFGAKNKYRQLQSSNNHCIAITQNIFEYFNLNNDKDKVIYDGVFSFDDTKKTFKADDKKNYFLYVGHVSKGKGVLDMLTAIRMAVITCPDIELLIVGKDEIGISTCIEKYNLRRNVKYIGFVNKDKVYSLMRQAKALIVPSYFEGFGFITAEAMVSNCLVIGRNTGGTKEQFDNALNYCKYEVAERFSNVQQLSEIIQTVHRLPITHYQEKIVGGYRVSSELYTKEKCTQNIYNFYCLINEKK